MLRNIFVIAARILIRNKVFSLINILGLSLGLTCSILILSAVKQEMYFDRFHEHMDHIFSLQQKMELGTGSYTTDRSGGAVGPALVEAFPEFSSSVRISPPLEMLVSYTSPVSNQDDQATSKKFIENAILAADSNFFSIFTFPAIAGDLSTALKDPYSVILTRETAEKFFDKENAINKSLKINEKYIFTVTAVLDEIPVNSSIQFDLLINFSFLDELGYSTDGFDGNPFNTFIYMDNPLLRDGVDEKITEYLEGFQDDAFEAKQQLLPLKDFRKKGESRGQLTNMIMSLLGFIILSIACINYMNLSTAQYLDRAKEVAIRKIVGAGKNQLVKQFLGETMIITFLALNLSIFLCDISIPLFNQHFEAEIEFQLGDPLMLGGLLSIFIITSLVAGSYPAFFLASFNAMNIFSKASGKKRKGKGIRKILVVIQFLVAILFIIASLVNFKQFKLLNESYAGFNTSDIIYFQSRGELNQKMASVKQEILQNPGVISVTSSAAIPKYVETGEVQWGLTSDATNDIAAICPVSYDFAKTFNMEMSEGRFYSEDMPGDSINAIVVNQAVAEALDLDDPIGQTFYYEERASIIIGILKNYNFNPISLMGNKAILPFSENNYWVFVKTNGENREKIIEYIAAVHEKYNPEYPFDTLFLDDYTDPITNGLGQANKIILFFTFFGIVISCLGLLGLSTYTTRQRTKEIGIRKSVGASSTRILRLLTIDFMKLILVSLAIAIPVSIMLMRTLLQFFAARITMGPGLFLMTAGIVILISILTISFQAIKAARGNPADSLRFE